MLLNTQSYEDVREFLRHMIPSWFGGARFVGGGGSMIIHIASRGLPLSRHPNLEAARLQTYSAPERLQNYQSLIEIICSGLGVPVYLFELSMSELLMFRQYARDIEAATRLGESLRNCIMPEEVYSDIRPLVDWNPALRLYLDGGSEVESLWSSKAPAHSTKYTTALRMKPLIRELLGRRRAEKFPVSVLFTEEEIDLAPCIQEYNHPFLMARQTGDAIEYMKVYEPW